MTDQAISIALLALALGVLAGSLLVWLVLRSRQAQVLQGIESERAAERASAMERSDAAEAANQQLRNDKDLLEARVAAGQGELEGARKALAIHEERARHLTASLVEVRAELERERSRLAEARAGLGQCQQALTEAVVRLEEERKASTEKAALFLQAKDALSDQFKALADEILEEKGKRFTALSESSLGNLLNPLRERIIEFKKQVEEIHGKDREQQAAMKVELDQLKAMNQQITEEAHNLATALKGQSKKQGNWGELILGNVLARSGLREGQDYQREVSFTVEGGRQRPDVVVRLPQQKHLIIDAKVSLNAYTRYVNADDDAARSLALREHVAAISDRIRELSDRNYFELPGLNTPEMVFMFIPVESAFVEALKADETLFQRAIEQHVLVATPTTLLTSLNIVRQLWRFEEQNVHTAELADRAGKVYKKLLGFLASMETVGKALDRAKESYGAAMGQLVTGKGNLINQAKEFERLGVSVQGKLPEELVSQAALELDHLPETGTSLLAQE